MKQRLRRPVRTLGLAVVAVAAVTAALTASASSHAAAPAVGHMSARPEISAPQTLQPGTDLFGCQSRPIDGSQGARCYTPQQIQQAYGYSGLLASGVDGRGKTIVIVDAYSNPYIPSDLSIQDSEFGLPAPPSYTVVAPQGVPAFDITDPNQAGWAEEITLDVLWAHAMAPGAKIVLVEGKSANDSDLYAAEKYAVDHRLGDVMSQSFGEAETCVDPAYFGKWQALFRQAAAEGITTFASSGDSGASQFNCDESAAILSAGWPASDPYVTAVGGTTLNATDPDGDYVGETAWTEIYGCNPPATAAGDVNCSGGGYSTIFGRPLWQLLAVRGHGRGVPDVSYDAAVNGGVLTHCGVCNALYGYSPTDPTIFFIFGGTSAGSPQWAALTADADQIAHHDLGFVSPKLYALAALPWTYARDFHDVTTGDNDVAELGGEGYDAGRGWDPVTGLGSPNAANLLPALAR